MRSERASILLTAVLLGVIILVGEIANAHDAPAFTKHECHYDFSYDRLTTIYHCHNKQGDSK